MKAFDLKRFSRLFVADGRATAKQSLLLCGAGLLLGLGYLLYCLSNHRSIHSFQTLMMTCLMVIYVLQGFYTYLQWQDLASRKRKAALLLQPVSRQEIFAVKTIYCFVVFPLACLGIMFLILWLGQGVNARLMDAATFAESGRYLMTDGMCHSLLAGLAAYALVASVYWTGSFFFKKWAPFKAAVLVLLAILFFSLAGAFYFDLISTDFKTNYIAFSYFWTKHEAGDIITWSASTRLINGLLMGVAVYLYVLSVYKFKETTL